MKIRIIKIEISNAELMLYLGLIFGFLAGFAIGFLTTINIHAIT